MSKVTVTESHLEDIGDAIRGKLGTSQGYTPAQMAAAIESIPTGGITPTGTINITQNGQTDVTQYATADVNVPNSYAAGDEGKVVQNGALVAQTSETVTQNGTYDTTTKDEIVVNVQGGTPNLQDKTFTQNGTYTADTGYDGFNEVTVNVSGGGGSGVVLSGTTAPTSAEGNNEDLYVQYSEHPGWNYTYGIENIYRKVNGAWETYVDPTDPYGGVHIWTKSTGGNDAAMYVQKVSYDPATGSYTPYGETVSVIYTSVQSQSTFDCFGLATLGYPNGWKIVASANITDGTNTYSSGATVATWQYNKQKDIYLRLAQ